MVLVFAENRCGWFPIGAMLSMPNDKKHSAERETEWKRIPCQSPDCRQAGSVARWIAVFTDASQQEICVGCAINLMQYVQPAGMQLEHLIRRS